MADLLRLGAVEELDGDAHGREGVRELRVGATVPETEGLSALCGVV